MITILAEAATTWPDVGIRFAIAFAVVGIAWAVAWAIRKPQ